MVAWRIFMLLNPHNILLYYINAKKTKLSPLEGPAFLLPQVFPTLLTFTTTPNHREDCFDSSMPSCGIAILMILCNCWVMHLSEKSFFCTVSIPPHWIWMRSTWTCLCLRHIMWAYSESTATVMFYSCTFII